MISETQRGNVSFLHAPSPPSPVIPCDVGASWTVSEIFLATGLLGLKKSFQSEAEGET